MSYSNEQMQENFVDSQGFGAETQNLEICFEALEQGATLGELHGFSQEHLEDLYSFGYAFYEKGQLDEAEKIFKFLCVYDFRNVNFLIGLAAVYQMKQAYKKAVEIYGIAATLDPLNMHCFFYAAQCQLLLGEKAAAKRYFAHVLKSGTVEFKQKAEAYLAAISKAETKEKK